MECSYLSYRQSPTKVAKNNKHAFSLLHTLIKQVFDQSEHVQGPIYIIKKQWTAHSMDF